VQVAKDLNRRLQLLDQHGLLLEDLHCFIDEFEDVLLFNHEWPHHRNRLLTISWREQVLDEDRVE